MEDNKKKEMTKKIVANLKEKINEFKSKKEQEKEDRVDALDFEINRDFIEKFKKHSGGGLNEKNFDPPKRSITSNQVHEKVTQKSKLNFDNFNKFKTNPQTGGRNNLNDIKSAMLNLSQDERKESGTSIFNNKKPENNDLNMRSFLMEEQTRVPIKSSNSSNKLNDLEQRLKSIQDRDKIQKQTSSSKQTGESTAKIKQLLFDFSEANKKTKETKAKRYDIGSLGSFSNLNSLNKGGNRYDSFKQAYPQLLSFAPKKQQKTDELTEFADFSIRGKYGEKSSQSRGLMDIGKDIKYGESSRLRGGAPTYQSTKFNLSEIRSLNSKLRLMSKDDAASVDRNVVEELLLLADRIKRIFGY